MIDAATVRDSLSRMEDHEILDRYRRGLISDEAKPIADKILRARGIDPGSPPEVESWTATPQDFKPRMYPLLLGTLGASTVGQQIGAALAGAVGAGFGAAAFCYLGWKVGVKVATYAHAKPSMFARIVILTGTAFGWAFIAAFLGLLVRIVLGTH